MKNLFILFCFLVVNIVSFGQSKKTVNQQLLAKLSVAKQIYDSTASVYLTKYNALEKMRKDLRIKQLRNLDMQRKDNRSKLDNLLVKHRHLNELGFDANSLVSAEKIKSISLPEYQHEVDGIKNALTDVFYFRKVPDTLAIKELKVKVQNERITNQLAIYADAFAENTNQLKKADNHLSELKEATISLDSISRIYDNLHFQLGDYDKLLQKKLNELKENYRKNGPKGFSKAYEEQFRDVFRAEPVDQYPEKAPKEDAENDPQKPEIIAVVEVPAEFPGGNNELTAYLAKNIKYPQVAKEMALSGKCYLQFVVSTTGSISDVKVMKGVTDCEECDREAIRVVKAMPNWIPAKDKGKMVNSYFTLPIKFSLD